MTIGWFGWVPVKVFRNRVRDGHFITEHMFTIPGAFRLAKWIYL
jgi:hypothetical protein